MMMVTQGQFADWYAKVAVTPPDGLIGKRWAAVEESSGELTAKDVLDLAKLFTLPNIREAKLPDSIRQIFVKHDGDFRERNNLQELRVLSGAILRLVIAKSLRLASLAALSLVCGSFGPREAVLVESEHLEAAERHLVALSKAIHEPEAAIITGPVPDKDDIAVKLPPNIFAPNQIPALQAPLVELLSQLASLVKQSAQAIQSLSHTVRIREEDVEMLWWLQGRFSKYLDKSFGEVGYVGGVFIFATELADITKFVPGPVSTVAVIAQALQLAGAPSIGEEITIANATNATPRTWREGIAAKYQIGVTGLLTPLLTAVHKSLDTDGPDEWLPVYKRACDIPSNRPFPLIRLSMQVFRERILLLALAEASK
jgi:hypothetical protein